MTSVYASAFNPVQPFKKRPVDYGMSIYNPPPTQMASQMSSPVSPSVYKPPQSTPTPSYGIQSMNNGQVKMSDGSVSGTPKIIPSAPKVDSPPASTSGTYIDEMNKISAEQAKALQDQNTNNSDYYTNLYAKKNEKLQNQVPTLQTNFDTFRKNTEAGITDVTAQSDVAKQNTEDQWGNDQRALAQTRLESEGRNRVKYAGLNTTDSYGVGSAGKAQENVESDFNRQTQQGLSAKSDKKFQIDQELTKFVRDAKGLITSEEAKLNEKVQGIMDSMDLNDIEKNGLIKQAHDEFQQGLVGLKYQLADLKYKKAQSDDQYTKDLALKTADTANLSQQFITTGIPQTKEDFVFRMKNPTGFTNYGTAGKSETSNSIVGLIDKINSGDVGAITGAVKTSWIPGTAGALTQNYYDQLKGMLSLENRSKLKGSGAISDFESKTLEKAASALGQNLSADQFKQVLNDMRNELANGGATSNGANSTIRVKEIASGQTGTIPANEFDPSLYQQIQ